MEKMELQVKHDGGEIVIREGKAPEVPPQREPQRINLDGDIHCVREFLCKRELTTESGIIPRCQLADPAVSVLVSDKGARTIVLYTDPNNYYGTVITGRLLTAKEIEPFKINSEHVFSKADLLKVLKFNRILFDDRSLHEKLCNGLAALRIRTESELKQESDNRGNKAAGYEQRITDDRGLPKSFTLFAPIFKGEPAQKFSVDLCYDIQGASLVFWLESADLEELRTHVTNQIFESELEAFPAFVTINK